MRKSEHRLGGGDRATSHREGLDPESELSVVPWDFPVPSRTSASPLPRWAPCLCPSPRREHFAFGRGGLDDAERMEPIYSVVVKRTRCRAILMLTQERKKERGRRKIRAAPASTLSPPQAGEAPAPQRRGPWQRFTGKASREGLAGMRELPVFHFPLQAQGRSLTKAARMVALDLLQLKTRFEIYREPLESSACLWAASGRDEMGSLPDPVTSAHRRLRGHRRAPGKAHCWCLSGNADMWFPGPCWGIRCPRCFCHLRVVTLLKSVLLFKGVSFPGKNHLNETISHIRIS